MVKILREADEALVAEVAKKHGVSDVTIYGWRKRFGKLEAVDVKSLRPQTADALQLSAAPTCGLSHTAYTRISS
jgi:transposase-like protein